MKWLCPSLAALPGAADFKIQVWAPWHLRGLRLGINATEQLREVRERISLRLAIPLGSQLTFHGQDGTVVASISDLQRLRKVRAQVIMKDFMIDIRTETFKATTTAYGCDDCLLVDERAAEADEGLFSPSALPRLAFAVLGSVTVVPGFWDYMRRILAADVRTLSISKFKTWHSICKIPLYACRAINAEEVRCAETLLGSFKTMGALKALQEPRVGHTKGSYNNCTISTTVMLQTGPSNELQPFSIRTSAMQLSFVCDINHMLSSKVRLLQMQRIVEFGAGYGGLAHTISALGFNGEYIIYDFEELAPVQRITAAGMNLRHAHNVVQLQSALAGPGRDGAMQQRCLFVAIYSLSEMPFHLRPAVLEAVGKCGSFFIKYQNFFDGSDNTAYFGDGGTFRKTLEAHGKMEWITYGRHQLCGHRLEIT